MMTPQVESEDRAAEFLHRALTRARLLLALREQAEHSQKAQAQAKQDTVADENHLGALLPSSLPRAAVVQDIVFRNDDSLHSVELEDECSDACQQRQEGGDEQLQQQPQEEKEDSVVVQTLPLPQLRWPVPTWQQRQEARAKQRPRQQKRCGLTDCAEKRSWFCSPPVVAGACAGVDVGTDDDDAYLPHLRGGSASSLTMTGDHSDRSSSPDTYAASHA
ncbi:hypothetical protein DQ04_18621010, partial [Trypanosoma grayi]|uniref:hypothetical protein n=1 Tax=Trypanosoma grayi TaxID=71804 RepID=UPI0004F3F168